MNPRNFTRIKSERRVIVRAWRNEPVVLMFHHADSKDTYVCSKLNGKTIGIPNNDVFAFDQVRLEALRALFSTAPERIGELYKEITEDDFACNKYQDNLELLHDQENITDSQRVTCGDSQ
jgi:hypothetical protein